MCTEIGRGRGGPLNAIGGKGTRAAALAQSTHTEGPRYPIANHGGNTGWLGIPTVQDHRSPTLFLIE